MADETDVVDTFDASRLDRTDWGEAQLLADELRAMFRTWSIEGLKGPVKVTVPDGTSPAFVFEMPPGLPSSPIQVVAGGAQWNIPAIPGSFNPLVTPDPLLPQIPGLPPFQPSSPPTSPTSPGTTAPPTLPDRDESGDTLDETPQPNPVALPYTTLGRVVSGTGREYVVDVWMGDPEDGTAPPWGRFPAKVMQLAEDEEIPAGTIVHVTVFTVVSSGVRAGAFYIQPPVTLGEE